MIKKTAAVKCLVPIPTTGVSNRMVNGVTTFPTWHFFEWKWLLLLFLRCFYVYAIQFNDFICLKFSHTLKPSVSLPLSACRSLILRLLLLLKLLFVLHSGLQKEYCSAHKTWSYLLHIIFDTENSSASYIIVSSILKDVMSTIRNSANSFVC